MAKFDVVHPEDGGRIPHHMLLAWGRKPHPNISVFGVLVPATDTMAHPIYGAQVEWFDDDLWALQFKGHVQNVEYLLVVGTAGPPPKFFPIVRGLRAAPGAFPTILVNYPLADNDGLPGHSPPVPATFIAYGTHMNLQVAANLVPDQNIPNSNTPGTRLDTSTSTCAFKFVVNVTQKTRHDYIQIYDSAHPNVNDPHINIWVDPNL